MQRPGLSSISAVSSFTTSSSILGLFFFTRQQLAGVGRRASLNAQQLSGSSPPQHQLSTIREGSSEPRLITGEAAGPPVLPPCHPTPPPRKIVPFTLLIFLLQIFIHLSKIHIRLFVLTIIGRAGHATTLLRQCDHVICITTIFFVATPFRRQFFRRIYSCHWSSTILRCRVDIVAKLNLSLAQLWLLVKWSYIYLIIFLWRCRGRGSWQQCPWGGPRAAPTSAQKGSWRPAQLHYNKIFHCPSAGITCI